MIPIASEIQALSLLKQCYSSRPRRYYGFYNSLMNKIITDEHLMLIPFDDRIATRAHGVFDVFYSKNFKIINVDSHIDRIFNSAKSVSIIPPFDKQKTKQILVDVAEQVSSFHLQRDPEGHYSQKLKEHFGIRMVISSGFGDLGISSLKNKKAILYLILFEPYISPEVERNGVNQYIVKYVKEPKTLTHSKTIDYLENSLMANETTKRGGYQGIKALENGVLLEASMANIGFIFGKEFATPRFETVIEGTTIKKLIVFLEQLREEGLIDKISARDITVQQAYTADQMIIIGGDKIVPVLNLDDRKISPKKGEITEKLQNWYEKMNEVGHELNIKY